MSLARPPQASFTQEYASGATASWSANPVNWVQAVGAGSIAVTNEDGSTASFTCVGGEVIPGTFTALTGNTCTRIRAGGGGSAAPSSAVAAGAPVNLAGGSTYVTGALPTANETFWNTAAAQTSNFTAAADTLYDVTASPTAVTVTFPAVSANAGRRIAIFNGGTTAAVMTPNGSDAVTNTGATGATAAGPAAGVLLVLTADPTSGRWLR